MYKFKKKRSKLLITHSNCLLILMLLPKCSTLNITKISVSFVHLKKKSVVLNIETTNF